MKYFSLFSGVGGFELGITQAYEDMDNRRATSPPKLAIYGDKSEPDIGDGNGGRADPVCIGFSEVDKYASQVLKFNHPGVKNYGDARAIDAGALPDFDVLVGGFPCQTFSIAGKRKGFEDLRGTLFFDMVRVAKEKKPKFFVGENVKGLTNHDGGKTFKIILGTLQEIGYTISYEILNAKNYGVPQNRERVFIIGFYLPTICKEIISVGQIQKTDTSAQIIKGFLCQTLLNNLAEVKRLQEIESKDSILGLLVLKDIIRAGQRGSWIFSEPTSKSLYESLKNYSPEDLSRQFIIKPEPLAARPNILAGTLFTEENTSHLETEKLWQSIAILLNLGSEENSQLPKQSTILTAISQITTKEIFTYAETLRTIVLFTLHLRNSSNLLWSEVLLDLIILKANTQYEPITGQTEERIIGRSGFIRRNNLPSSLRGKPFLECGFRDGSPPEVFFERGTDGKDIQNLEPGANQAGRRYDTSGLSPTIPTASGGRHIPMIQAVLTPDRLNKRQNGRRMKTDGEPMFTLNAQDKHGVYINAKTNEN